MSSQYQFRKDLEITSKSMSLAEGIVSRGIREMRCNTDYLMRELARLASARQRNPFKAWEKIHCELPKNFTFIANGKCKPVRSGQSSNSRLRRQLGSRNKKNKEIDSYGFYFFFEKASPKTLRLWTMSPDFHDKNLFPVIYPVCNVSHHAMARIFFRLKEAKNFHDVMNEMFYAPALEAMTMIEFGRELHSQCIENLWEEDDIRHLELGTSSSCIPTRNGIFLIMEPKQKVREKSIPGSLSDMYFSLHPENSLAIVSTWVPYDKIRRDQKEFMDDILMFWKEHQRPIAC